MGKVWHIERSFGEESAIWRCREDREGEDVDDAVIVRYSIFSLHGDARHVLERDWERNKKDWPWIRPAYIGFNFDLDELRQSFPALKHLDWLQGKREIEPDIRRPLNELIEIINHPAHLEFVIKPKALAKRARLSEQASGPDDSPNDSAKRTEAKRVTVPPEFQSTVLTKSRRRCCICFGLNGDSAVKTGQIAHLDRNPGNYELDNLAWLCLPHHDQYDSKTSVSKNFTMQEVKKYRDDLYSAIESGLMPGKS